MLESKIYDDTIERYLKRDFQDSIDDIRDIRFLLRKNELIRINDLQKLRVLLSQLHNEHDDMDDILEYIDGLLKVKGFRSK